MRALVLVLLTGGLVLLVIALLRVVLLNVVLLGLGVCGGWGGLLRQGLHLPLRSRRRQRTRRRLVGTHRVSSGILLRG